MVIDLFSLCALKIMINMVRMYALMYATNERKEGVNIVTMVR